MLAVVGLVSHHHNGQLRTAQNVGNIHVKVGNTILDVDQKQHKVCFLSSHNDLFADFLLKHIVTIDHPAAGVDHGEFTSVPLTLAILAVARSAGLIADDGPTRIGQSIKQCGLADVRASYDRY